MSEPRFSNPWPQKAGARGPGLGGCCRGAEVNAARYRLGRSLVLAVLLVVVAVTARAEAQVSPRQQAADLAGQLMSPFCPGRPLVDCTSSQAYDLRETISRRLTAGESVDAVRAGLVREYGAAILGAPAPVGIGLLAWFGPALLGLATSAAVTWKSDARGTRRRCPAARDGRGRRSAGTGSARRRAA